MGDASLFMQPKPPAPEAVSAEVVANANAVIGAAQQANLRKIQAQATMWQCISILIIVLALGLIVPTMYFCFKLMSVIDRWAGTAWVP